MRKKEDRMVRVITCNRNYDYVFASLIPFYVKKGYVIALAVGEEIKLTREVYEELERQEIDISYDLSGRMLL